VSIFVTLQTLRLTNDAMRKKVPHTATLEIQSLPAILKRKCKNARKRIAFKLVKKIPH